MVDAGCSAHVGTLIALGVGVWMLGLISSPLLPRSHSLSYSVRLRKERGSGGSGLGVVRTRGGVGAPPTTYELAGPFP